MERKNLWHLLYWSLALLALVLLQSSFWRDALSWVLPSLVFLACGGS